MAPARGRLGKFQDHQYVTNVARAKIFGLGRRCAFPNSFQAVWKRFSSPQKLHATGRDPRRRDRLSIFLLSVRSQSGRNLGPR